MFKILLLKEIKNILLSPKFVATFVTASILIMLSVYIGLNEYKTAQTQYETGKQLANQLLRERTGWGNASTTVYRAPDPMQIFVSGVSNDIGRLSAVDNWRPVKLQQSIYSDDPLFAIFRSIDLAFIIQVVLSLLAILFTYDSINGEREGGTLKLVLSNAVPRWKYLVAKLSGAALGLLVPLSLPFLLSILMVMLFGVSLENVWTKLILLLSAGLFYFIFFICLGVLVSALTRTSSSSFMFLLVFWVLSVLILPRVGTMAAAHFINVPSQTELESQIEQFSNAQWKKHEEYLKQVWEERNKPTQHMSAEERSAYNDEHMWEWMEEDDKKRQEMQHEINATTRQLKEEMVNRKQQQEKLGLNLARISPAAVFGMAAMNIANSDIHLKNRTEREIDRFKDEFTRFAEDKQQKSGGHGGIRITMDSETGMKISVADMKKTIDLSEVPRYTPYKNDFSLVGGKIILDFGLLTIMSLITLAGSFGAFLRYDVR